MKKISEIERKETEECLFAFFQNEFKRGENPFDHCSQYDVTVGNHCFRRYLYDGELRQIIGAALDIFDELHTIYDAGFCYDELMKAMDEYGVIVNSSGVYDRFEGLWIAKFCTEGMRNLIKKVKEIRKIRGDNEELIMNCIIKIIVCCYIAMIRELDVDGYDATTEYLYILTATIMEAG